MDFKNKISDRSCSAVQSRSAGRTLNDSVALNSTRLSSIRQSITDTNFLESISRKKINEKSKWSINNNICSCYANVDGDLSDYVIQDLKCKLQNVNSEFIREKNSGLLLKRDVLIAKKVVEKEIAVNKHDFKTLLEKADSGSWKGRQEIIFALKLKLRQLREVADSLNDGTNCVRRKKKFEPMNAAANIITDDRTFYWFLELEKREVWKNMERYRQKFVTSRDVMKANLERLTEKIEKLEEDIHIIRQQLSIIPRQINEDLIQRLQASKNQLKAKMEEKGGERRMINVLEQEICRKVVLLEEIHTTLAAEKRTLKLKGEKIKSLKDGKTRLQTLYENARKEKYKQAEIRVKKIESVEIGYDRKIVKSENIAEQIKNSKFRLERKRKYLLEKSSISFIKKSLSTIPSQIIKEQLEHPYEDVRDSKLSSDTPGDRTSMYNSKLLKYQSIFRFLDERNGHKMKHFIGLIDDCKEWTFELVENRCLTMELTSDIKKLKAQSRKLKKRVLYPTKQKYVKKKNSSQQMLEIVNERKAYLAIREKENKCLKTLIRHVMGSKGDDCNILENFYLRNKDAFIKKLSHIKP